MYGGISGQCTISFCNKYLYPDKLHGRQQADYAFLLTQARDKNYLDSLQSDSLIKIAIDYYEDHNDKVKAGKASFYYGTMLSYQDKSMEAMNAYLNAQILLEGTQEYKLQGLLEENIGMLNYNQRMYDASILNFRKTVDYYKLAGDTLGVVYGYRNLARGYMMKASNDTARRYVDEAIETFAGYYSPGNVPLFFRYLESWLKKEKDYEAAIGFFWKALSSDSNTF